MIMLKRVETLEMSQKELEEAVNEWLSKSFPQQNHGPWNVKLVHNTRLSGYGMNEREETTFSVVATRDISLEKTK